MYPVCDTPRRVLPAQRLRRPAPIRSSAHSNGAGAAGVEESFQETPDSVTRRNQWLLSRLDHPYLSLRSPSPMGDGQNLKTSSPLNESSKNLICKSIFCG